MFLAFVIDAYAGSSESGDRVADELVGQQTIETVVGLAGERPALETEYDAGLSAAAASRLRGRFNTPASPLSPRSFLMLNVPQASANDSRTGRRSICRADIYRAYAR